MSKQWYYKKIRKTFDPLKIEDPKEIEKNDGKDEKSVSYDEIMQYFLDFLNVNNIKPEEIKFIIPPKITNYESATYYDIYGGSIETSFLYYGEKQL